MDKLLEINIKRLYYENCDLLHNISLKVNNGDRILIVGATGAGKSSLLSTFNLMNRSFEGSISFLDKDITDYKPEILRSRICMVMQEPFLEDAPVQEILDLPMQYASLKHKDWKDRENRIKELMQAFQLPEAYLAKPASQLSGGEKQRVALIRVLQLNPQILLLDEISSALDQKTSGLISDCIFGKFPGAVIAISHDPLWQNRWQRTWNLEDKSVREGGV